MDTSILSSSPILLIVALLGFVTLTVGLVMTRIRKEEQRLISKNRKNRFYALLTSGISISLLGGFFMFDGDILGEGTVDIARIMGYAGLGLIIAASTVAGISGNKYNHR